MKPWLFVLAALSLTACSPADQKVRSVKERLDAGEVVEFSKPGYRRPSCREGLPDWKDYRVANDEERMRIVVRKQASALNPGPHSCFRVGSEVIINSKGSKGTSSLGLARITKLSLVRVDKLKKSDLQGKFFASNEDFYAYKDNVQFRLKPDHQGIVTILDFDYVKSSALDETELVRKDAEQSSGDAYEETAKDGDTISDCNKPWVDVIVPEPEYQQAILSGKLKSYYNWGSRNCLAQGQEANIKAALGDSPVLGKVKIAKIKKFRAAYVDPKYFAGSEFDLLKLKTKIQLENRDEFITVMDFESDEPEIKQSAPEAPLTAVRLTQEMTAEGVTAFFVMVPGRMSFREGDLTTIRLLVDSVLLTFEDLAVRVLSQEYNEGLRQTVLKVQRLQNLSTGAEL